MSEVKPSRKFQILETLALQLEKNLVSESPQPNSRASWVCPRRRCIDTSPAKRTCSKD